MTDAPDKLIARYRSRGAVVDANLLLLFFVGTVSKDLIPRFHRTRNFEPEDYDTLDGLLRQFRQRFVTPNVMTEVSNLAGQLPERDSHAVHDCIRRGFTLLTEEYVSSQDAAVTPEFGRFGLSDAVLVSLARRKLLLITADFPLAGYVASKGLDVINFNHLRSLTAYPVAVRLSTALQAQCSEPLRRG